MATGGTEPQQVVVSARDLSVHYRSNSVPSEVVAVRGVSFDIRAGEIFGLLGESGSGKSTLAATIAGVAGSGRPGEGVPEISGGELEVLGTAVRGIGRRSRDALTLGVGYLPQDAAERLSSDLTVAENVAEPIYQRDRRFPQTIAADAVATLIDAMRLPLGIMDRMPWELSSGQRQRVAIARSLILEPTLLVADEPARGVDVTVRSAVLDALRDVQLEREFSVVVVSSELSMVSRIATRVGVLQRGILVGLGELDEILDAPHHPYLKGLAKTRALEAGARAQ